MDNTYERQGFALNTETHKLCSCCGEVKSRTEYYKNRSRHDGIGNLCKICEKEKKRERNQRPENKARHNEYHAKWRAENKEKVNETQRRYREKHREKIRERKKSEEGKRYAREYIQRRRQTEPAFRMKSIVSRQVHHALSGKHKAVSTFDALPYTPEQLAEHLEKQFDDKMTWDNYGSYWSMDHIYPQSKLPYDSMEHPNFAKCWALENLRPLEHKANIIKGNRVLSEGDEE